MSPPAPESSPRPQPRAATAPVPAVRPAVGADPEPDSPVDRLTRPFLAAVERVFLPARLRPPPGHEPPARERVVSLLRRPLVLITLAVVLTLLVLWAR